MNKKLLMIFIAIIVLMITATTVFAVVAMSAGKTVKEDGEISSEAEKAEEGETIEAEGLSTAY